MKIEKQKTCEDDAAYRIRLCRDMNEMEHCLLNKTDMAVSCECDDRCIHYFVADARDIVEVFGVCLNCGKAYNDF